MEDEIWWTTDGLKSHKLARHSAERPFWWTACGRAMAGFGAEPARSGRCRWCEAGKAYGELF